MAAMLLPQIKSNRGHGRSHKGGLPESPVRRPGPGRDAAVSEARAQTASGVTAPRKGP